MKGFQEEDVVLYKIQILTKSYQYQKCFQIFVRYVRTFRHFGTD